VIRVKICGIHDATGRDAALAAGADWLGFVFFSLSPRALTPAAAAALAAGWGDHRARRVGLFVTPGDEEVAATLAEVPLDVLQVYATAERCRELRRRFGVPVWQAVGVAVGADLPTTADGLDGLVIEPKPPLAATRPGGNATVFEWSLTRTWQAPGFWLLAGGLTPDNVRAAITASGATAVDVSSGVERAPGCKDPALIAAFIAAARGR
jgi:phosphoribosylanthranilate isomerase